MLKFIIAEAYLNMCFLKYATNNTSEDAAYVTSHVEKLTNFPDWSLVNAFESSHEHILNEYQPSHNICSGGSLLQML